jgi:hypothetical protein
MGAEMTAPAAAIATIIIEPEKRLGMTISSLIREKQDAMQAGPDVLVLASSVCLRCIAGYRLGPQGRCR